MAFKSIGTLAGSVLANVENMRAAAAEIAPQEFETADRASSGEAGNLRSAQDEPAHLLDSVRGLTPTSKGMRGKTAAPFGDEAQRQVEGGNKVEQRGNPLCSKVQKLDIPNTMLGSMTAARRRSNEVIPASAAVIDLSMERARRAHARSFSRTG